MQLEGTVRSVFHHKIILYIDNFQKKKMEAYTFMKITNYIVIECDSKKIKKYVDKKVLVTIKKKQTMMVDDEISIDFKYKLKSIELLD